MRRARADAGAAVVDFVLVSALASLLFLAVVQLAAALHVRNTLVDCASEGARHGALADRTPADGAARTRELISLSLAPQFADQVSAGYVEVDGLRTVEVRVDARLPVLGLLGPRSLTAVGHGAAELQ